MGVRRRGVLAGRGRRSPGAQVAAGEITGIVKDQARRRRAGRDRHGHQRRHEPAACRHDDGDGVYTAPSLAPGDYRVDVELSGFKPVRRDGIRRRTGEKVRIDFDLAVGDVREQVTVTADAPMLRAETASLGTVVEQRAGRAAAAERPHVHHARVARARRRAAAELAAAAHQRRPAAHERVPLRRHLRAPARAGPGRVLPGHRRDSGVQDREQQPAGRVRPLQRRRRQPDDQGGHERASRQRLRVLPQRGAQREELLSAVEPGEAGLPPQPVRRHARRAVVRDRTFFFVGLPGPAAVDRPHGRSRPCRRCCSARGSSREAIGGRVPVIYDPATTVGRSRTPFPSNTIPLDRMDPVALALLQRYPLPTSSGTANNYTPDGRTRSTTRISGTSRIDHRFSSNRDQVFGRLSYFRDGFVPVTPLPDGSGVTTGTLGPQDTTAWAFASNYQHTFSATLLNELRIGDTRRTVGRTAAAARDAGGSRAEHPGHSVDRAVSQHAADVSHRRLSAARLAAEHGVGFSTSVTEVADSLTWLKGRHTLKMGLDWRWERLNVIQPPSPTGSFTFNALRQRPAGYGQHGHAARELPARPGPDVLDRPAAGADPGARALPGVLHPGRLEGLRPADDQPRPALHAELPVDGDQRPDGGLQPADAAARVSGRRIRCGR